ncbi:MAG: N-acetylneuraminate synthase family protein [Parcubacteria group bacterium]|nr:N-acetylneuraminate synthase family protein [Parcubacteria group bacterium]
MNNLISIQGGNKALGGSPFRRSGLWPREGGDEVFIIADIGKNFIQTEEDRSVPEYLQNAKDLVDAAVDAGVDAAKFQIHELEDEILNINIVSPHFKGSDRVSWITRNMNAAPLEEFWKPLKQYCDEKGIIFFGTPMSRKAAQKLEQVGVPFWKVGSGDVQDYAALDFMIETGKPIIISTGMVGLAELDEIVEHITSKGSSLVVLYCISQYPAPKEYFNLGTIEHFKEKYPNVVVGFSDHSLGYDVALAAVKLGAKVIEKHFSFSRDLWGADHKVSMTPHEMKEMVDAIRGRRYNKIDHIPYYGVKEKELEGVSNMFRPYFNKSLMAGTDIPANAIITKEMVFAMRPKMYAGGLPSQRFYDVVGKISKKALKKYEPITEDILE